MAQVLINDTTLTNIADAIREKTGKNDAILPGNMATEIEGIKGGGQEDSYISFINCDGTEVASWTREEMLAATELPPLPSYGDLVCQEWNWTLNEIKKADCENIVGAIYTTNDGHNKINIVVEEETTIKISFIWYSRPTKLEFTNYLYIDWGDGSLMEQSSYGTSQYNRDAYYFSKTHKYAPGSYTIDLEHIQNEKDVNYLPLIAAAYDTSKNNAIPWSFLLDYELLNSDETYYLEKQSTAQVFEKGKIVKSIHMTNITFNCYGIDKALITMSKDVFWPNTSRGESPCFSNRTLIYPRDTTDGDGYTSYTGNYTYSTTTEIISFSGKQSKTPTKMFNAFESSGFKSRLRKINVEAKMKDFGGNIPPMTGANLSKKEIILDKVNITNNFTGGKNYIMSYINGLESIKFKTYSSTGNGQYNNLLSKCSDLKKAEILYSEQGDIIPGSCFQGCQSLEEVIIPSNIKKFSSSIFDGCIALKNITLPENLESIGYSCFSYTGLSKLVFPSTLTTISGEAFSYSGIKLFDFRNVKHKVNISDSTFNNIRADARILIDKDVITEVMNDYNWSKFSDYIESDAVFISPITDTIVLNDQNTGHSTPKGTYYYNNWAEITLKISGVSGDYSINCYSATGDYVELINLQQKLNLDSYKDKYILNFHFASWPGENRVYVRITGGSLGSEVLETDFAVEAPKVLEFDWPFIWEKLTDAEYSFIPSTDTSNFDRWAENDNKFQDNSYCMGRLHIYGNASPGNFYLEVYQDSEYWCDYGIVSELNYDLPFDNSDSGNIKESFGDLNGYRTVDFGWVDYDTFIDIKYKKDSSSYSGEDVFRFRPYMS